MPFTGSDIIKLIFAFILPPLGVFLETGCGAEFIISILLTILGWVPGIIYAMYVTPLSASMNELFTNIATATSLSKSSGWRLSRPKP